MIIACLFIFSIAACNPRSDYKVPEVTNDGWLTSDLQEVGMDEKPLQRAVDGIRDGDYDAIHSMLIIKDGKLVFEDYFSGYSFDYSGKNFLGEFNNFNRNTIHNLASVTKIITSTSIGLAIDHGFIQSVDEEVSQYFPEYFEGLDEKKASLQLKHFLTMTSGLEWNQLEVSITDFKSDLVQMWVVEDPIGYVLGKPLLAEPGKRWYYSEGDVNVLGEVIQSASGLRLDEFTIAYLFEPLGIQD
jgi:CubicO group peptidase (beta-lactamase class C family)